MKRYNLPVLLVATTILCATAATVRAGNMYNYSLKLTPPPGSDFPHASGFVSMKVEGPSVESGYYYYDAFINCRVSGLAPSSTYSLCWSTAGWYIASIYTDAKGQGKASAVFRHVQLGDIPWHYIVVGVAGVELSSK